ncbi:MAG: S8 family serine peptidase, partial [Bifidobacteriaceae bacterium]|nr:S8 family serine peptidase [Bifidobacteriaceae bacterium]
VASIIAARTDDPDDANMTGAAQNNAVMLYRASGNSSQDATQFDIGAVAKSVRDAADHGAKVILIETADQSGNATLKSAIDYAYNSGAVIVAPAGTADQPGKDPVAYPAAFSDVISVGAVDRDGSVPDFSTFANAPDIVAPGSNVVAMTPGMNDDYSVMFGTAYAAAYVAAAAALVIRSHPGLRPMDVATVLEQTANHLSGNTNDAVYGNGALDAGAAVEAVTCGSLPGGATVNSGTWLTTPVANLNLTAGTPVGFRLGSGGASSVSVVAGSFPPGVTLSRDATGWVVSGTPTYFGDVPAKTYTATLLAQGSGQQQVTITMTVGHASAARVVPYTALTSNRIEARAGVAATVRAYDQYGNSWSLTGDQNASITYPSGLPNCTFKAGKGHAKRACVVTASYRVSDAQTLTGTVKLTVYDRTRMKVKITGTVKARGRLRAKATPKGWPVTYRWYKGSHAIKHATKSSYKLPKKVKKGTKYRVKITLRFGDGTKNTKASKYVKAAKTTVKH